MSGIAKFICLFLAPAVALAQPLPEAADVLKRMQTRMEQIVADSTNTFRYIRTNVVEELDSGGKTKKRTEKTYEVAQNHGLPRARLIAIDGRTLPESEQRWRNSEEQRLQRVFTQDKSPDPKKPKPWLTDDLLDRFVFKVGGRTNHQGRAVLILDFQPREGAPARNMADRVVNNISGLLWVDEVEAEIARIDIWMTKPVKFWGGILGQLDRFDWTLSRMRSPAGVWFNHLSTGLFHIRKLFATSRFRVLEESADFQRAQE